MSTNGSFSHASPTNDALIRPELNLVVGIGASAGGLAAFKTFLDYMPSNSGMSFVLVQHLDPHFCSTLVELLAPHTSMRVSHAEDGARLVGDCVYVIPPDATLTIADCVLHVTKPAPPRTHRRPIDSFFTSLAEDQKDRAVCIVLSGLGSDGTEGLRAINLNGGLTLAQAEFDETAMKGMPTNAAATGLVDHIVLVEDMPKKLLAHQAELSGEIGWRQGQANKEDWRKYLKKIASQLRTGVGHDFADYKENTLIRRVQRRMQVLQIDDVATYITHLEADPHEADLLFRELLIGVTQFFRDPDAFNALRVAAFPSLFTDRSPDDPIRVWVAGCATGEEVYSLAILLKESMEAANLEFKVQLFGTDIDPTAIAIARSARYRGVDEAVSSDRLKRWFAADGDVYCPIKTIREMCVFSTHSIIKDPPFSKLDLISCRNVLIYLNSELQHRVIRTFHHALKPAGYLFLGPSESVARDAELFTLVDKRHRILQRRENGTAAGSGLRLTDATAPSPPAPPRIIALEESIDRSARRVIEPYSPVYFVIDRKHDVVRFSGPDAGDYLEPSAGTATLNLFSLLRRTLRPAVRAAILKAETERRSILQEVSATASDGRGKSVSLIVEPIESDLMVVAFRDQAPMISARDESKSADVGELRATKAELKAAVSELEIYMEEAKSANEEMQSVNEELQSTNEELETSKEEMQSINEELQTVNAELQNKNTLLGRTNDDLQNLLDSTQIATLFLDSELRIRNFTPAMTNIFYLRSSDLGRPITDISSKLDYGDLVRDVEHVQRTLGVVEREVQPKSELSTFLLRIRPYRTRDNRVDGVVLTFMDLSEMKAVQQTKSHLASIVQSSDDAIISVDLDGVITTWNVGAHRLFGYTAAEAIGMSVTALLPPDRENEEPYILMRVRAGEHIDHYETVRRRKDGSSVDILLTVSPVKNAHGAIIGASKIAHDISERKRADQNLAVVMHELSHRSKNLLAIIGAMAQQTARRSPSVENFLSQFGARVQGLAQSHDLLTQQNWTGALLESLVRQQLSPFTGDDAERLDLSGPPITVKPDAAQTIGLALHELGTNASKYGALSVADGKICLEWKIDPNNGEPRFQMWWREVGGPRAIAPTSSGFGRILIENVTAQKLQGISELEFAEAGVTWMLDAPAAVVVQVG
jgi:two-component system CheB/CheR fusion protein